MARREEGDAKHQDGFRARSRVGRSNLGNFCVSRASIGLARAARVAVPSGVNMLASIWCSIISNTPSEEDAINNPGGDTKPTQALSEGGGMIAPFLQRQEET
jgi:hypothetical protein